MTAEASLSAPIVISPDEAPMTPWKGSSVIEGDPAQAISVLFRGGSAGSDVWSSIWSTEPCTLRYTPAADSLMYIIEGDVDVELDDGTTRKVGAGDVVVMPKGVTSTWHIKTFFREFVTYA
jgi:uncharacterized cupin superfamily protein